MNKPILKARELMDPESDVRSHEHDDEPVINERILRALREKLIFDAASSKYGRLDDFNLNTLRGLTLNEALVRYPKLMDIMDDVLVKVSSVISEALEAEYAHKETAEEGREFALLLKRFGMWFYRNGQSQKALKAFEGSLEFLGEDAEIFRMMGDIYYGMGDYRDALVCFKEAFRLSPDNSGIRRMLADTNVKLAEMFLQDGSENSVKHYSDALGYIENYLPALCGLGDLSLKNWKFDDARSYFDRALTVDPSNAHALNGLANVHVVYGEDDEAESLFQEVILKNQFYLPALYDFASFNFRQKKNYLRAMGYLDRAQQLDPKNIPVLLLKVEVAMEMADFDTAEHAVEKILELQPSNKAAFDYYCRLKNGDCFLPEKYLSSFRSVHQDRQKTSRDHYFSLRYRLDPDDATLFENYVIEVAKDQGDKFGQFRSPYDGRVFLN